MRSAPTIPQAREVFCTAPAAASLLLAGALACAAPDAATKQDPPTPVRELANDLEAGKAALALRRSNALLEAVRHFERAAKHAPESAQAWAGLAEASALLGLYSVVPPADTMPRAARAAETALRLDPDLAATRAALGLVRYLWAWDWPGAERELERAIELDPESAEAHLWLAMLLSATGRHAEAVVRAEQALATGAELPIAQIKAATVMAAAGLDERAEAQLRICQERYPENSLVARELGFLRIRQHRPTEAIPFFERAAELAGGEAKSTGGLGLAYGLAGRTGDARRVLAALEDRSEREFVPPLYRALVHVGLGETEEAFDLLEEAFEIHDPGMVYLQTKPGLAELAREPRGRELARRIGLPERD